MRRGSGALVAVAALAAGLAPGLRAAPAPPASIQGHWEVTRVGVDRRDQPHWLYEPDDPRLLGRALEIGADGTASFDFGNAPCDRVDWAARPAAALSTLVGETFPRPPRPGTPRRPALSDFALKLGDRRVEAFDADCPGVPPPGAAPTRWAPAWVASLGAGRLIAPYGEVLLILDKIDARARAVASFPCGAAHTPTEHAICGSQRLAGYDRSVAAAYRRRLRRADGKPAVEQAQRAWLAARDACRDDAACIADRLQERLEALMQD